MWVPLPRKLLNVKLIEDHEIVKKRPKVFKLSRHRSGHLGTIRAAESPDRAHLGSAEPELDTIVIRLCEEKQNGAMSPATDDR